MSHYILIAVSTQTNNKSKILINVVQYACKNECESLEDMRFFNNAVKGVPCDSVMIHLLSGTNYFSHHGLYQSSLHNKHLHKCDYELLPGS